MKSASSENTTTNNEAVSRNCGSSPAETTV